MVVSRLIERKRDGQSLTREEWASLLEGYVAGAVGDYQMAAMLMAVFFRGLDPDELDGLTEAMIASGARLTLPGMGPVIDKHSTGGVGDKVSLVLAPLVASCGVSVPMMSGRGLGHTGGTLDKLEAIPGFRTDLSLADATTQLEAIGCVMIGQTGEIAPADRKLYALRDVTGTVESIPLIAASIMSKKLAEGLTGLVLDVKTGSGAFLPEPADGLTLAQTMIGLGHTRGCPVVALLTAMDRPLGRACGNAIETEEALAALRGEGPDDLMTVTYALGREMLRFADPAESDARAEARLRAAIEEGRALDKFREIITAQGGNPAVVDDPALLPQAPDTAVYEAPVGGFVAAVEPRVIGHAIVGMGGGRSRLEDAIDLGTGFCITARPGQRVERGEPLATVFASGTDRVRTGLEALARAIRIVPDPPSAPLPLLSHRVTVDGVEELGVGLGRG